jgi:hypothetical protein
MGVLFEAFKIITNYFIPGVIIIGLAALILFTIYCRKSIVQKIKVEIVQKEYLRLILALLLFLITLTTALNLLSFKLGLTADRFWNIKDYIISLFFILTTFGLVFKKRKFLNETRIALGTYALLVFVYSALYYLLGGIMLGSYLLGYELP